MDIAKLEKLGTKYYGLAAVPALFGEGVHLMATNGYVLLAVPAPDGTWPDIPEKNVAKMRKRLACIPAQRTAKVAIDVLSSWAGAAEYEREVECHYCQGDGTHGCDCGDEHGCAACDGRATETAEPSCRSGRLFDAHLNRNLVAQALAVVDLAAGESVVVEYRNAAEFIHFRGAAWHIVVMPLRFEFEENAPLLLATETTP